MRDRPHERVLLLGREIDEAHAEAAVHGAMRHLSVDCKPTFGHVQFQVERCT